VAEEKKPGLLKRIFSFGFGKKKETEVEDNSAAEEAARQQAEAEKLAAERVEQEKLAREEAEARRLAEEAAAAERLAAEEEAEAKRLEEEAAAKAAKEAQALQEAAEREEAKRLAAEKLEATRLEAERLAQEEAEKAKAEQIAKEEAEKLEAATREAEEKAAQEARFKAEEAQKAEQEKIAAEKKAAAEAAENAEREEAARLELEAKKEAERIAKEKAEADRLEAERLEREKLEQARLEAADKERQEQEAALRQAQDEGIVDAAKEDAVSDGDDDGKPEPDETDNTKPEETRKVGWFKRLTKGLAKSSSALTDNITSVFTKKKLDEDTLQELEDILIQADLGVETAMNITDTLATQRMGKDVTDEEVRQVMADEIAKVLEPVALPLELDLDHQPHVILVVGVNGSGKTTTIGKISQKLYNAGFSTLLVAGDTFRAAAVEQLHIWGDRTQAPVMSRGNGADAAGLAFDAYAEAVAQKKDVMLMDTAGRLQNKKELMDELEKIIRVLKKQDESAPHTVLLTLDATTGQNALNQVEIFKDVAGVNGLVMTKLDGTARGGILVSISAKHKLPIYFIGVGEQVEDLEPFEADVFARAIAGIAEPV